MKKTFVYSALASAVILAVNFAYAEEQNTTVLVQNLFVKQLAQRYHVIVISAFTATFTALICFVVACASGRFVELIYTRFDMTFFLFLSCIYGMLVGMLMAFAIMQKQGIVTYNVLLLIVPIATALIGYLTLGETLSGVQLFGALLILLGGMISLKKA